MKKAVYPGSFNPWHKGHQDILLKALGVFDEIIIAVGVNPSKPCSKEELEKRARTIEMKNWGRVHLTKKVQVVRFEGLLKSVTDMFSVDAVVRGLRNGNDLQYEQNQQYWNEDLGIDIPTAYFITDRKLGHISSSAIRAVENIKRK